MERDVVDLNRSRKFELALGGAGGEEAPFTWSEGEAIALGPGREAGVVFQEQLHLDESTSNAAADRRGSLKPAVSVKARLFEGG